MIKHISVGIDIGTRTTRLVVAEHTPDQTEPVVLALVSTESKGLRHGYIINADETKKCIAKVIKEAEKITGINIKKVLVSIGGISLGSVQSTGSVIVGRADREITERDIENAVQDALSALKLVNRKVIFQNNIQYKVDGKETFGSPIGLKGTKLEVRALFAFCLDQHIEAIEEVFVENGIDIVDIIPAPIAGAHATLTERQRSVGVALANIGAETVSLVVYENNVVIGLHVFSIGGSDITNDIALGFQIELENAEQIKLNTNDVPQKRKLQEIINARLSDIFELIGTYLKKIKRYELLPAGMILTGGSAAIQNIEEYSKGLLKLPSKKASIEIDTQHRGKIREHMWNVPYGLILMAQSYNEFRPIGNFQEIMKSTKKGISDFLKQFLP